MVDSSKLPASGMLQPAILFSYGTTSVLFVNSFPMGEACFYSKFPWHWQKNAARDEKVLFILYLPW